MSGDDDMTPEKRLEHALWVALICWCERCNAVHDLGDIDYIIDDDALKWSALAASRVKVLGWSSPDSWDVLCPRCSVGSIKDKAHENPYATPAADASLIERRHGALPWWLRPGGTPSIVAALPFVLVLLIAIVIGVLLPVIQWLWR